MPKTPAELVADAKRRANTITCEQAIAQIARAPETHLIDVREPPEHAAASIPGSVNIPRGVVEFMIGQVCAEPETPMLLFCASGGRAAVAAHALVEIGYSDVTVIDGPFEDLSKRMANRE